jgi:hypothetical protein
MSKKDNIVRNLDEIRGKMDLAAKKAGRAPGSVRLIPVTKTVDIATTQIIYDLGFHELGENRVEAAQEKIESMDSSIKWHMIGTIQRRKAKLAVQLFDRVDSVDRSSLAQELNKRCEEFGKHLEILVQVNVSGEESKQGIAAEELDAALVEFGNLERLEVKGLMTMAPAMSTETEIRGYFQLMRKLAEKYSLPELSMGMTNDYEWAIEEGATEVRIGSALFKA